MAPFRKRRLTSTSVPDSIPLVLVHTWFFDFLEDPSEFHRCGGYALHDLVTTIAKLRRVNKEWRDAIDSVFAAWKRSLGVNAANPFWMGSPCLTLYDVRGSTRRSCFFCGKPQNLEACSLRFMHDVPRVDAELKKIVDVDVCMCERCNSHYFEGSLEPQVNEAFEGGSPYCRFFKNTSTPATPFERFSGCVSHMVLDQNEAFRDFLAEKERQRQRRMIELRLVRHAKRKDFIRVAHERTGIKISKDRAARHDLDWEMREDGHVSNRLCVKVATKTVLDRFICYQYGHGPAFGFTSHADALSESFVDLAMSKPLDEVRVALKRMQEIGKPRVRCRIKGLRFFASRHNGVVDFFHACFNTLAVWVELEVPALGCLGTRATPAGWSPPRVECVLTGRWLHRHFSEGDVAGHAFAAANRDIDAFVAERREVVGLLLDGEEFNKRAHTMLAHHEVEILAALNRARNPIGLDCFANALNQTIDRDTSILLRLLNPDDPGLGPAKRKLRRGFPSFVNDRNAVTSHRRV